AILSQPLRAPRTADFQITLAETPHEYAGVIAQVVLVERLREVRALTGFTRIESLNDYTEEDELPKNHIMRLANKGPFWVPAAEVRGEGLFLQLREEAIQRWLQTSAVQKHNDLFRSAHTRWRQARRLEAPEAHYPELRYVLLHTFAHALMRQLTLACGYTAASIRERIYAQEADKAGGAMAGILLYTADSDSEGTLGGLVSRGKDLGSHILGALEALQYCASDPLCAEHTLASEITLHGSACHACLFAPETSCERGNRYLDRSVLIPTVDRSDVAFFRESIE
ncbi:MAG: DrmB family protein, partial [Ktedonobacteraceae bacterium]